MRISELVAALTAELIRGNDAEIGFTVPLDMRVRHDNYAMVDQWLINGRIHQFPTAMSRRQLELQTDHKPNNAEFRHREDGVMEIVLT